MNVLIGSRHLATLWDDSGRVYSMDRWKLVTILEQVGSAEEPVSDLCYLSHPDFCFNVGSNFLYVRTFWALMVGFCYFGAMHNASVTEDAHSLLNSLQVDAKGTRHLLCAKCRGRFPGALQECTICLTFLCNGCGAGHECGSS
jgi:hypothetical protein